MFTGIVQGLCKVTDVSKVPDGLRLAVDLNAHCQNLQTGASVAINGCCLTVVSIDTDEATAGQIVSFDVITETLSLTNLGLLQVGDLVNVERSIALGDEIGGHFLSGHVTTSVQVKKVVADRPERLWFKCPKQVMRYLFHKGFVALDGASLTVSSVDIESAGFSVDLIPETRSRTTLGRLAVGDKVNLEVDSHTQATVDTLDRLMMDANWLAQFKDRLTTEAG